MKKNIKTIKKYNKLILNECNYLLNLKKDKANNFKIFKSIKKIQNLIDKLNKYIIINILQINFARFDYNLNFLLKHSKNIDNICKILIEKNFKNQKDNIKEYEIFSKNIKNEMLYIYGRYLDLVKELNVFLYD